jgi:hypothetical protein
MKERRPGLRPDRNARPIETDHRTTPDTQQGR